MSRFSSTWVCLTLVISGRVPLLSGKGSRSCTPTTLPAGVLPWNVYCPSIASPSNYRKEHSNTYYTLSSGRKLSAMSSSVEEYKHSNLAVLKDLGDCEDKKTDVIVAGRRADASEHILFFGGDVQDYPEQMMSHRDNGQYVRWNSLAMAALLCRRFPSAMVMVIKPHHMHLKTFSVYSQFVESNDFGVPTHSTNYGAWQVLVDIYTNAVSLALQAETECLVTGGKGKGDSPTNQERSGQDGAVQDGSIITGHLSGSSSGAKTQEEQMKGLPKVLLHLIGFSKGCIVLNQFIYELEAVKSDKELFSFVSQVKSLTWLDGGHSGGSNTWVTDPNILKQLAALSVDITVHVTPYQVKDEMRKWIGKEKRRFVELLLKSGAKVSDNLHFDDLPKSIDNHFRVLEVF